MDFNKMSDYQLAEVMVRYINRVEHLLEIINRYLHASDGGKIEEGRIKAYYKELKNELRCDANNVSLVRNKNGSELYMGRFRIVLERQQLLDLLFRQIVWLTNRCIIVLKRRAIN